MLDTASPAPSTARAGTLRRFYAFQLTAEARFDSAIWIIYLQSRGFSLAEIGLAESAFHLAPLLIELPSGSFADLVGRRWSLAIGAVLIAASTALLWWAPSLPLVLLALFLSGASFSFRSGADQAYLYDAMGAHGHDRAGYAGLFGRLLGAAYVVGAAATWLGAALSEISYGLPFGLMIGAGLGGFWLAAGLTEPARQRQAASVSASVRAHVADAREVLASRPAVRMMLALSGLFWTAFTITYLYLQAAFAARGLSNSDIGLIAGVTLLLNAAGASLAGRVSGRWRFGRQFALLAGVAGAGLIGTAAGNTALAIASFLAVQGAYGLIEPLISAWFNRHLPSEQRATILSLESWIFSLTMIVAFPAAGWVAGHYGWGIVYSACGAATIAMGLAVLLGTWRGPEPRWLVRRP